MHTTESRETGNLHAQDDYAVHLRFSQELYGRITAMPALIRTRLLRLEFKPEFLELANRALEEADLAVRANSRGVLAHIQRGRILHMLLREEEAQAAYRTAIACDPQDEDARAAYAHFLMRRGELQAAREQMEAAFLFDPARADMLALRDFIEAGERDPAVFRDYWMAYIRYGVSDIQSSPEEIKRMIRLIQQIGEDPRGPMKVYMKLRPEDKEIRLAYGKVLFERGEYTQALRHFKDMQKSDPNDPDVRRWLDRLNEQGKAGRLIGDLLFKGIVMPISIVIMSPVLAYRWLCVLKSRDLPNIW
ncbi:hypothetical protein CDO73_16500 [Saccharibacillus sp. O23]|uniref:tetratricopeptide repeat protein n=1 Tax=Saccharibacillus sp. O23 TaxID=2009338 RepID=UPI000B4E0A36|nr:tetratricopeptide repeat protein [Saccharibacillus sp. O23]OWR29001.1 hypothetical protein CDO73_16500 [Saccharibacillus sp. O23]